MKNFKFSVNRNGGCGMSTGKEANTPPCCFERASRWLDMLRSMLSLLVCSDEGRNRVRVEYVPSTSRLRVCKQIFPILIAFTLGVGNVWGTATTVKWARVTDISTLTSGGTFIMGYEATAKSGTIIPLRSADCNATTSANGYFNTGTTTNNSTNGTIDMSTVTSTSDYEVYISSPASGKINIQRATSSGNYYGASSGGSSKNTGRLYTSGNSNETNLTPEWASETNNQFKLTAGVSGSYKYLKYNTGSPRFAYYNSAGEKIVFYKKVTLSSISVRTAPTKTSYAEGESFAPAGLVIRKTWSDNSTEDITYNNTTASDFTFSPSTSTTLTTSNTSVTITYGGKSTSQSITVAASGCDNKVTLATGNPSNGTISFSPTGPVETCDGNVNVTMTITPNAGYYLSGYSPTGVNTSNTPSITTGTSAKTAQTPTLTFAQNANGTYTAGATFTAFVDHFIDNIQETTGFIGDGKAKSGDYSASLAELTLSEGDKTTGSSCRKGHYHFCGWVTEEYKDNPHGHLATINGTATGTTYYAVWAKEGAGGGSNTISIDASGLQAVVSNISSGYSQKTITIGGYNCTASAVTRSTQTGTSGWLQLKKNNDYILIPELPGPITNISSSSIKNASNGNVSTGVYFNSSATTSQAIASESLSNATSFSLDITGTATSGYFLVGAATCINQLSITYGSVSYADSITACCTELGSINGSVTMSQTTAALEWADLDHVSSWAVQYKEHSAENWNTWNGAQATANNKRSVTITSLSCGTVYDFKIAVTAASNYCDAEQVLENKSTSKWNISYSLSNTVALSNGPAQGANACGDFSATFSKNASYTFPENITVQVGGATLAAANYTWNNTNGTLSIDGQYITGNVVVTIAGVAPPSPTISATPDELDFGEPKKNEVVTAKSFALTGSNLTDANTVTVTAPTGFLVSIGEGEPAASLEITPSSGSVSATIIVTPITTSAGDKTNNLTISTDDLDDDVEVGLYMDVQETYTVNFYINSITTPTGDPQTDVAGTALTVPTVNVAGINDCADANYVFKGWTNTTSYTHGTSTLITNTSGLAIGNADADYYAVFALKEGEDGYAELTDVTDLTAGDKIVITGKNNSDYYGMKAYDGSSNNFKGTAITIASNQITDLGDACELTLGGSANAWTFYDGSKYVYSAGSSKSGSGYNNYMKGQAELTNAGKWTISITNGVTSITSNGNSATPNMRFNYNQGSTIFSCYNTASQSAVTLYRKISATYSDYRLVCPHTYIVTLAPATNGNGTISFAKNASAITEIETTGNAAVTVDVVAHPATGYELTGVALSSEDVNVGQGGASYSNNVITIPANEEGTLTATATFGKVNYAVSYTAPSNGTYTVKVGDAAAVSSNTTAQYGQTITLAVVSPAEGYQFIGWTVTKTASSTAIAVDGNNQFTMPAEAVTVAANFQAIPSDPAVVTFNAGAGTLVCNDCTNGTLTEENAGDGITLPSCTPATGYAFLGWTATQNKETIDDGAVSGATYLPAGDMILYAVYAQLTAITLKKGNGTNDEVLYADITTGKVTLPERNSKNQNYTFAGWSTKHYSTEQEDANPSIIEAGEYTPGADITLYPVFSVQVPVTIWTKKTVAQVDGAGTYAIIDEDGYAFNGTMSSGHGQHTTNAFSFTNNVASAAPAGTCELTFAAVTGGYTLYNEDYGYLYATKASSGGLSWHASESSYWVITTDNWLYNSNSAYLRVYDHTFRTYAGASNNALYFAKKESQNVTKYNAAPANDVAAPTFLPVAGAYYGAQNVTISCETEDVTIYYTDDDSEPSDQSTEYEGLFSVSSSKTIKAVAIDEDGYSSAVAEAAYTINPIYSSIAAYKAASAQEAATARVLINKESANAIVIAVIGAYSYIQDGTAAMVIKRPNNENQWTVGSELDGYVQGTRSTYYGLPMITVADIEHVSTSAGTLPTVQPVSNLNFAGAWISYAGNLIKVENVYFQAQATSSDKVDLQDGAANTCKLYDAIHFLGSAALPLTETACDITGILVAKTENEVTTYYIAPTALTDISTKGAVAQLNVNPIGGADAGHAAGIAPGGQVTITPVDGFATTLGGEAITTVSTVPVTAPTSITVSATRQFYADNEQTYYYDVDNTYMPVTVNQPTDVGGSTISANPTSAQAGNTITLSYNLAAHYHFNSWNVYKTGDKNTTVDVDGNNQFEMPEYAVTVEAEIEEDAYANVLFADGDATSGEAPTDANKYYVGDQVTMPGKNTLAKSGSTFGGWSFGGNDYEVGDPYTIIAADVQLGGKDITFTAQWTPYPWGGNGKWELVTDANEITVSPATYVIFADTQESDNKACGETQNTNNRATVGVSITDGILTWTGNSPAVFTVEAGNVENTFAFFDAINNGYIYAAGTGNDNHLKTKSAKDTDNAAWAIESIDSETGEASVRAQSNNRNLLQVNGNVCAAYNAKQKGLAIYKFVAGNYYNINYAVGDVDEPEEVSNMPATQVTANDGTATLSSETPIYVGKLFQNWKDEDADQTYEPGANVTLTQNVTLTAQWADATAHSLSYNLNGGTLKEGSAAVPYPANYYPYAEVTVTSAVLEKEDVIFIGWEYNGDVYGAGASFEMPNKDVVLTAKFAKGAIYTVATAASVTAQGAPEGSSATFANTYTANKEQMTGGNSMTLTLSGYKGYLIKNITLSMHANNKSGAGTFSATVGGNSIASIASTKDFNAWYDNNSYGSTYRDVHVEMTSYPTVGAYEDVEIVIAATANSLFCQSFTVEYEVAPVEINNTESIDASDILPGADVTVNDGGTLVIDEEKELNNITIKDGATVTINEQLEANDMTIEAGGTVSGTEKLTVNNLIIKTTLSTITTADKDDDVPSQSGQITLSNDDIEAQGDVFIEITLTQSTVTSGWYAFSVPFPVSATQGVYYGNTQLRNETDYAIMAYHEELRAAGQYAWKKYRDVMVPGQLYIIAVGDTDYKTLLFKKEANANIVASSSVAVSKTAASGDGQSGWNGLGNPNLQTAQMAGDLQFLDHENNCFHVRLGSETNLSVGSAFMYQYNGSGSSIVIAAGSGSGALLAPARTPQTIERMTFRVKLINEATNKAEDIVYLRTSQEATNTYEIGRDLSKMSMGNAKCAQMCIPAYGTQLCIADFPLVNNKVTYPLTITAPQAGTYSISTEENDAATIYLTKDGHIIWNLSMSPCEIELPQGQNNEYGLVLRAKAPEVTTDIENSVLSDQNSDVQKVIIDEHVYILRGGEMYDVTGKMVR